MRLPVALVLCLAAVSACAPFPELDAAAPEDATPPQLLPIEDILAQAQVTRSDPGPALAARAARLRARAAAISTASPSP